MKSYKQFYILFFTFFITTTALFAQKRKTIIIKEAGFGTINENTHPGARILTRNDQGQVHVYHDGIDLWCDKAIIYSREDFVEAYGNVIMKQGDTINMNAKYAEYSGKTQLAYAKGNVVLVEPSSKLTTEILYFDRVKQQAYYNTNGTVERDSSGTITSRIGCFFTATKKYQFEKDVILKNPQYQLNTNKLDYYTETAHAYMYGPSTIKDSISTIYSERGFYDTKNKLGFFVKKSRIDYDNRSIEGDSLFFNQANSFASASNNIVVTDTLNNSIIKGHYAEVYKEKDSVFITKRALAITLQENDSIYIHADTLMVTGKPENRITRAFRNAKFFKTDLSGKADSIHVDQKTGLTKLINLDRLSSNDVFAVKRRPVMWNLKNQMSGDTIHIKSNPETEKLDSLIVFNNAFLIGLDTISENSYNQVSGKRLVGLFNAKNKLNKVNVIKNVESIYYSRNDNAELIGVDKAKCARMVLLFENDEVTELRRFTNPEAKLYPEKDIPVNARKLRGFDLRLEEQPKKLDDLFSEDHPYTLPKINGLKNAIPEEDFFDTALLNRIQKANTEAEKAYPEQASLKEKQKPEPKASRRLPKALKQSKGTLNPELEKSQSKTKN